MTTDAAGTLYDAPWVTPPEPRLEANLYAGGEVEGWAIFQVPVGEEQPLLVFQPYAVDSGRPGPLHGPAVAAPPVPDRRRAKPGSPSG